MSSPLATFRKHRTFWMAGLVLLAIMAFVVAPAIDFMQGAMRNYSGGDQVLVRWNSGRITAGELERSRQQHYKFVRFLSALSKEVIEAGGQPQIPEFAYSPESKQIIDLGVNVQSDNLAIIETRMLADLAKMNGIEFDDDAADEFIVAFCDARVSPARLAEILRESTDKQVTEFDLRELIKLELSAIVARQMALRGWSNEFKPDAYQRVKLTQTPGDMWNDFLKLNRSAKLEAYPVLVSDFTNAVTGEPTESEILAIYEAGKNRVPSPNFPAPGFMRDYKANFEFVEGNYSEWVAKEKANVSDEQLQAEYERMVALGQLKYDPALEVPKTPAEAKSTDSAAPATSPEVPATTAPASEAPAVPASDNAPATGNVPAPDKPAEVKPEVPAGTVAPPETGVTDAPSTIAPPVVLPASTPDSPASPAPDVPAPASPAPGDQSSQRIVDKIRLVSAQDEPKPAVQDGTSLPPVVVQPTAPSAGQASATATPTDSASPATAATSATATTPPATETPATGEAVPGAGVKPELRTKTFEEAKEELRENLARAAVIDSLQKVLTNANEQMQKYATSFREKATLLREGYKPETKVTRPNLKKLTEVGLKHGETGLMEHSRMFATDIGKSTMRQEQGTGRVAMPNFAMNPNYALFTPAQSVFFDEMAMLEQRTPDYRQYIFWKTEEQLAYVPELAEARTEVIAAWKTQKARKLAADEAEKIAKKVIGTEEPWKTALTVAQQSLVVTTDPFTWLSGFGETPRISNVPTLDTVGDEFMQKVFVTPAGSTATASNQGQNIYYVFRVVDLNPPQSELETRFSADPNKMAARRVGMLTGQQIYSGLYETIEEKLNVKWEVSPAELSQQ